jgi:AraC-like DNA-binding protein
MTAFPLPHVRECPSPPNVEASKVDRPSCQTLVTNRPMILNPRPVDLGKVDPHSIRHASSSGTLGSLRVIVREHEDTAGAVDLPGGTSHFWLAFRPAEAPERMLVTFKDTHERCFADRSLYFFAPRQRLAVEWRGGKGPIVHFLFSPAFLLEIAASLHLSAGALTSRARQEVALEEPLEGLCRLLMREVEASCPHGPGYLEALGRALACALVKRLGGAGAIAENDLRVERAIRFFEQQFHERITVKAAARVAGLSPDHLVEVFRSAVGCTPHQYLIQCRLRHARQLIASVEGHHWSLAEIALEAGFFDQAHLSRHFHRAFGQSPGQWRQQTLRG